MPNEVRSELQPGDITNFLASSVHDMKNSTTMLVGFLEETLDQVADRDSEFFHHMAHMLYEVKRVNGNLVQLLAIYKIGAQLYPLDVSEQSVWEVLQEFIEQSAPLMRYKGIELELDCPDDLIWYFDRDLLMSALVHPFNNAINYTRNHIRIVAKMADGQLQLRIEDNGRGYPDNMLEAGNALFRGIDFTTGSTGLGLYFSQVAARMHHNRDRVGSIGLENGGSLGGGCFLINLP